MSRRRPPIRRLGLASPGGRHSAVTAAVLPGRRVPASESLAGNIRALLTPGGIRAALQPVVRLADRSVLGYEALCRFVPRGEIRTPNDLFAAASATGLDKQVYRACLEAGFLVAPSIRPAALFLNVAVETLMSAESPGAELADLAEAAGVAAGDVVVEISERTPIRDLNLLRRAVIDLRSRGFAIAIDDAGAGHASMLVIAEVEPDFIKIDRELIHTVDISAPRRALVVSLLSFGVHIDARVVAEGIETEQELKTLLSLGVEFGQGWHLGRPAIVAPAGDLRDVVEVRPGWFGERPIQRITSGANHPASIVVAPQQDAGAGSPCELADGLLAAADAIRFERDPLRILEIIGAQLQRVVPLSTLSIYAANHRIHRFLPVWATGPAARETMVDSFSMDAGVTGWAFALGSPQYLANVDNHPAARTVPGTPTDEVESMLLIPLIAGTRRLGMLNCSRPGLDGFTGDQLKAAAVFGTLAAAAWHNAELLAELDGAARASVASTRLSALVPQSLSLDRPQPAVEPSRNHAPPRQRANRDLSRRAGRPEADGGEQLAPAGGSRTTIAAGRSTVSDPRLVELSDQLDHLEMMPFSEAEAAFAPAVAAERTAGEMGATDLAFRAQLVQADVLGRRGKFTASGQLLREINGWAVEHGHRHIQARSHRLLSMFFDSMGDFPTAWEHAVRAVELVDETMSDRLRADHLLGLGVALVRTGSFEAARERYGMALKLAQQLGDVALHLKLLNNLAWLEDEAGDPQRSMTIGARMRTFANRHKIPLDAACLDTIAHAQLLLGHYEDAERTLQPILDDVDLSSRETEGLAESLRTAAEAQRLQGHTDRAREILTRCIQFCDQRDLPSIRVQALYEQAELSASEGQFKEAYQRHKLFHSADMTLRSAEREASARTLQAVFETAEARREGERFRELALRDPLTGLRNRRFVDSELPALLRWLEEEGTALSVALVDLDHFKVVNDTCSHAVGDEVLRRIARLLGAATAHSGFAARMGGEEFLIVFPELELGDAMRRAEDMRQAVSSYAWEGAGSVGVTVSIGVASARRGERGQAALLSRADRNLYAAKQAGRDRVVGSKI